MRSGALFGASLIAGALATAFARPAAAEIVVHVDKEMQTMTVTVDRQVLYVWPVSTGMIGRDTPSGTFHPNRMDADHHSQEWDGAPMPNTIFFDLHGHATHGFASITHLGNPASHGCVRLAPPNAAILFDLVKMEKMANTTVIITGTTPTQQAIAKLRLPIVAAANAPLTREALTHRSSDQAQPYDNAPAIHIKEAAAYQPPQTSAVEDLIPTPTFAMAGAKWQRRLAAMQLAALAAVKPPAEPAPLSHAADRQAHEPAISGRRQAASALVTELNEQPRPPASKHWSRCRSPSPSSSRSRTRPTQNRTGRRITDAATPVRASRPRPSSSRPRANRWKRRRRKRRQRKRRQRKPKRSGNERQRKRRSSANRGLPPTIASILTRCRPPSRPSAQLPASYHRQRPAPPAYARPYYSRQAGVYAPHIIT